MKVEIECNERTRLCWTRELERGLVCVLYKYGEDIDSNTLSGLSRIMIVLYLVHAIHDTQQSVLERNIDINMCVCVLYVDVSDDHINFDTISHSRCSMLVDMRHY